MRIMQVLNKGHFNTGSVHQCYDLARGLAQEGHEVTVAGRPGTELETRVREAGIRYLPLPFRHEVDFATVRGLARYFKRESIEVVHVHKGLAHTLAFWAVHLAPVPCFVANRGVSFPLTIFNRGKYRSRRCHRVVCVCEAIRKIVIKSGHLPPEKVVTVYAGTDLSLFDPSIEDGRAFREGLGYSDEDRIVCQIGLREWRGWRTLIAAFSRVVDEIPRARLLLVAARDKDHRREIMKEADRAGIGNVTKVLGYRADMPAVAAAQDIAVDLSYAGLGITGTLREAMAMGRAVVCSSAVGNPELVLDGETGLIVPPKDPEKTAEALITLLKNDFKRKRMGELGHRRILDGFSLRRRVERLEQLYAEVLSQTTSSSRS